MSESPLILTCGEDPYCRQCAWNAGTLAVEARREAGMMRQRAALDEAWRNLAAIVDTYSKITLRPLPGDYWQLVGPDAPKERVNSIVYETKNLIQSQLDIAAELRKPRKPKVPSLLDTLRGVLPPMPEGRPVRSQHVR